MSSNHVNFVRISFQSRIHWWNNSSFFIEHTLKFKGHSVKEPENDGFSSSDDETNGGTEMMEIQGKTKIFTVDASEIRRVKHTKIYSYDGKIRGIDVVKA